jgi:two-component system alkaline phosphatase synthesis response regulator PhoP/two-component system response regulator VicR
MGKILVVDDQPHIVRLLQLELERAHHTVVTATDGEEALDRFRAETPDIVILDVVMPKKDGFAVLREIKSDPRGRQTPVIMLTIKDHDADVTRGLEMGADWYLPKPFNAGDVTSLVQRFLAADAAGRAESPSPQSGETEEGSGEGPPK